MAETRASKQNPQSNVSDQPFSVRAFTDPVFAHISSTFSTRELVQLNAVSKQFAALVSKNSIFTALARSSHDDDPSGFYFPLELLDHPGPPAAQQDLSKRKQNHRRTVWTWTGEDRSTRKVHTLPSLDYLPFGRSSFTHAKMYITCEKRRRFNFLIESSGSLLLFALRTPNQHGCRAWNNKNLSDATGLFPWMPFLVTNPVTKEYRVLPAPANAKSRSWDYHGARAHLVEDECANEYKLLVVFRDSLLVYKSTTKCWSFSPFKEAIPWGLCGFNSGSWDIHLEQYEIYSWYYNVACAIPRGRKLLYAELEVEGESKPKDIGDLEMLTKGGVRMFEVDDQEGTWKVAARYALKDFIPTNLYEDYMWKFGFRIGSYGIEMVECMGGLYILIPAYLDVSMRIHEKMRELYNLKDGTKVTYEDFGFIPLQFYILKLKGDGLSFGQAWIHPMGEYDDREDLECYLYYQFHRNPHCIANESTLFRCRGWGNVIHIFLEFLYVQYNVMTGVAITQFSPRFGFNEQLDLSYRPSLRLQP